MTAASATDHEYMARALALAARGLCSTDPNPRVGCVLVRDGLVVGEGFHAKAGSAHAEVQALLAAGEQARGATAYVTLEPCSHHGRTGPCADALIAAGIARVVYASLDPNPQVSGAGAARLQAAGIRVDSGVLAVACEALNVGFFARHRRGLPWVRIKLAASLDGRTALANGKSQWITSEAARTDVHAWRARSSAILTGAGTLKKDDPRLTVRDESLPLLGRKPLRVVLDRALLVSPSARLFAEPGPVLIITESQNTVAIEAIRARGAEVMVFAAGSGLREVLQELARRECNEVWVEAGAKLAGLFLQMGLADELMVYLAPHLLGQDAAPLAILPMLDDLQNRWRYRYQDVRAIGPDLRLTLAPVHSGEQ